MVCETGEEEIGPSLAMARMNRGIVMANEQKQTMTTSDGIDWKPREEPSIPEPPSPAWEHVRELQDEREKTRKECAELEQKLKISEGEVGELHSHVDSVLKERDAARTEIERHREARLAYDSEASAVRHRELELRHTIGLQQERAKELEAKVAELTEKNKRFYIPSIREENMEKERDAARTEITKLMEQIAYQRDLKMDTMERLNLRLIERDEARREHAASEQRRENEVASLQKELDETKAELAREQGAIRQRFSAGSVLIDCGIALDAAPTGCRSREGLWFPDGKGTPICYRCLVRQSQRCHEELQKAEVANAELLAKRAIDAGGESLPTGRRIVLTPMLETEKLAIRIKELEGSLETLRNEVKGGRYG